jgi:hypothetical protein
LSRLGLDENEHIDIPSCQRLTMETGGGGTTNGVLAQCPFVDEALEDSTDFLHDFLMDSS